MSDQLKTIDGKKILALLSNKFHITQTQELTVEKNGNYEPDEGYDAFSKVTVAVPMTLAKQIDVEFPAITISSSDITQEGASPITYKCYKESEKKTYSGYKYGNDAFITSCEIKGKIIDAENTELMSTITNLTIGAIVKRWATFDNGVLTTWSSYTLNSTTRVTNDSVESLSQKATMTIS